MDEVDVGQQSSFLDCFQACVVLASSGRHAADDKTLNDYEARIAQHIVGSTDGLVYRLVLNITM